MELLERLDCVCTSASYSLDALNSSLCSCNGSNIEYTLADSALSDVAVVLETLLVVGSVDDDIYLAVGDSVKNVGSALLELADLFSLDAVLGEQVIGSACSDYLEAESLKILAKPNSIIGYGSFKRDFEYDYLEGTEFVIYAPEDGREISANVYDAEANKVFTITAVRHGDMVEVSYTGTDKSFSVKVAGGEAVKVNPTAGGKVIIKL